MSLPKENTTLDDLNKRLTELAQSAAVIQNTADSEKRPLNEAERAELRKVQASFTTIEEEISLREANAKMQAKLTEPQQRVVPPMDAPHPAAARPALSVTGGLPAGTSKGTWGFRSVGDFAITARKHHHGHHDARIVNAPTSYGSEGVNQDGGFVVPPDFRANIVKQIDSEDSLLSRTDQQQTSSNALALPKDSVSPWDTANGVQVAWMGEGSGFTQSKPGLSKVECKVHKIGALVSLTDELLEDAGALAGWLNSKVPDKLTSALNDSIINGSGNGQMLGLMNSGAKVSVAEESAQTAATVVAANIVKMWSRMYGKSRLRAVWLVNQDVEPQLQLLTMPGTNPSMPVYVPPGGFSQAPYATLLGRPIIPVEACAALGTEGDIILTDFSQYLSVLKTGGMRTDTSIHLFFDTGHTAMRFEMRVGGQPYWDAPLARKNGSNTLSPIVTLATRS